MFEISQFVIPHDHLSRVHPDDQLGAALEHTTSSHDIVLVVDEKDHFLGIVTPSLAFFKKRYPSKTKVKSALVVPPHLTTSSSLYEAVEHMLALGAYSLPVFDDGSISGLITASNILTGIVTTSELLEHVKEHLEPSEPLIVGSQTKLGQAYDILKKEQGSRMIVTNDEGKIEGIVTRRDIQEVLVPPSRRKRFMKGDPTHMRTYSFDEEKLTRFDYHLTEIYTPRVVTLSVKAPLKEIIQKMLDEQVNSIVLVNFENKPVKIVSVRTILRAIEKSKENTTPPVKISDQHHILSDKDRDQIEKIDQKFIQKIQKIIPIKEFVMDIDGSKNRNGNITNFEIHSNISSLKHPDLHAHVTDKQLMKAVKETMRKIEHQLDT